MGLYLCVFRDDDELEGVEIGSYADFDTFRSCVTRVLEGGYSGSRFPTLILHSDCDGEWKPHECAALERELREISREFQSLAPTLFSVPWQQEVSAMLSLKPASLYESFIDVDGEPLIGRLIHLCEVSSEHQQPILFQ